MLIGVDRGSFNHVQCESLPLNLSTRAFQSFSGPQLQELSRLNQSLKTLASERMEYSLEVGLAFMAFMVLLFLFSLCCTPLNDEDRMLKWCLKILLLLNSMASSAFVLFPTVISYKICCISTNLAGVFMEAGELGPLSLGSFCCSVIIGLCTLVMLCEGT
jgi:hypothetical protein